MNKTIIALIVLFALSIAGCFVPVEDHDNGWHRGWYNHPHYEYPYRPYYHRHGHDRD